MAEIDNMFRSMRVAAAGLSAQGTRLRVIAENIANANSLGQTPGSSPYRRKTVTFRNELDRSIGMDTLRVDKIGVDRSEFEKRFDPQHPAADADGYVLVPNVNTLVEMMDMREAQRSYEANLGMVQISKAMLGKTIDLIGQ
mgnify:CR=1 FL=1